MITYVKVYVELCKYVIQVTVLMQHICIAYLDIKRADGLIVSQFSRNIKIDFAAQKWKNSYIGLYLLNPIRGCSKIILLTRRGEDQPLV